MPETFPRRFGRYVLIDNLAQGGMGSLYLAYQGEPGMEKLCVVKTVLRELADKEYVARFRDEASVVVRLSHGNLVPVFDAGTVEGELYIAMDHVDGRDLRAVWNRCAEKGIPFPVDVAVYIIRELCRGLHHAHTFRDLRLVHRDVSPPNVLLGYSGEIKLTDFGLANSALKLQHTMPGIIYGKVSYMSPEQAKGAGLDGRADVYAAGVILWELLTGRQLFPNTDGAAIERVRCPEVTRPSLKASRVPLALDPLVMKALAPEAEDRYPDAEAFRSALAAYLAREAPTIDNARVATFLRQLFGDEIERDRSHRDQMIVESQMKLMRQTLGPHSGGVAPPPQTHLSPVPSRPMASGGQPVQGQLLVVDSAAMAMAMGGSPSSSLPISIESAGLDGSSGLIDGLLDGRYRVIRLVGEGGMGRVYEAEHIEIGKRVAIKVLHPTWSRFPELVARFRREARAASRIGHPNIIDVTDSGTTANGGVYIVMEFLEGADLAEVIHREKALGIERAIGLAAQLARALEAAHAAGVIHRDLKPENVFLVARGGQTDFLKVLDFGIARNLEGDASRSRLTQPNMAMGTPQYMSPEQAAGKPADARSDVYGVGVILYEMLVGHPPHQDKNNDVILQRKLKEVPPPVSQLRPDVPAALSDCIATALARDPAMRQQRMSELAEELERCRPDRRRGGERVRGQRGRTPWLAPLVAGGVSLLVVAVVLGFYLGARPVGTFAPAPGAPKAAAATGADPAAISAGRQRVARRERVQDRSEPGEAAGERSNASSDKGDRLAHGEPRANDGADARHEAAHHASASVQAPKMTPADAKRSLDEATRLLRDHQLPQAERAFQRLVDAGGERAAAMTGLARVAFEAGRHADAVKQGERAVQLGGGLSAHRVLGDAYFRVQRYDAAVREYRLVLKAHPDDPDARRHLEAALAHGASAGAGG